MDILKVSRSIWVPGNEVNSHLLKVLVREGLGETWINLVPEENGVLHRVSWNIRYTVFTAEKKEKYVSYSIRVK